MAHHFTEEEAKAWLAKQPRKPMSSKVAVRNARGEVLVIASTFKAGWDFPGGVVDENESPLRAAAREMKEEIGIEVPLDRIEFLGVRYGYSKTRESDYLHFVFGVAISDQEIEAIVLDDKEVADSKWIKPDELTNYVTNHFGQLAQQLLTGSNMARYSDKDEVFV